MAVKVEKHSLGITWVEQGTMARAAHAVLDGARVWLIDPFDDPDALTALHELGEPAGVFQLLDRHNRDCEAIAGRLEVPHHRLPIDAAGSPFEPIPVLSRPGWREVALWWPSRQALIVAEAVGTGPAFAVGGPVGVHPFLRLLPPRAPFVRYDPTTLLVGHGAPVLSGAAPALHGALANSRREIPKLLLKLPRLLRG